MPTILLRLKGPMQSWGIQSRFVERDSGTEPSKSGVIGLICAALGRDRSEPVDDLASMMMGVRVNSEGLHSKDYHIAGTKGGIMKADNKVSKDALPSNRYYLADADFLVGFENDDLELLRRIHLALKKPVWPLFLGRKSFVPSLPVYVPDGIKETNLTESLINYPLNGKKKKESQKLRFVIESTGEETNAVVVRSTPDQPVSFELRQFLPRSVEIVYYDVKIITED